GGVRDGDPLRSVRPRAVDPLNAILGPPLWRAPASSSATAREGLAFSHQRPLSVVLSADDADNGSALGLCDALGYVRSARSATRSARLPKAPSALRSWGRCDLRGARNKQIVFSVKSGKALKRR